jgi:deazaflavin-dependent oxidoreductase (nitroreductase family)
MNGLQKQIERFVTQSHVTLYRSSGGLLGGWPLSPVLLLTTTGRQSQQRRTTPLTFFPEGKDFVVIASYGGGPRHPAWWLNLKAEPQAEVEVGPARHSVVAREAEGEERERLWRRVTRWMPMYAYYQSRTERHIPVVVLERD